MDLCGTEALRGEQSMWFIYVCSSPGLQDCRRSSLEQQGRWAQGEP